MICENEYLPTLTSIVSASLDSTNVIYRRHHHHHHYLQGSEVVDAEPRVLVSFCD